MHASFLVSTAFLLCTVPVSNLLLTSSVRSQAQTEAIGRIRFRQPRDFPQDYCKKFQQAEIDFLTTNGLYDINFKEYARLNYFPASISNAEFIPLGRKPTAKDFSFSR